MVFASLQIVVILLSVVYYYCTRHNNHWKDRNVPSPKSTFFFGHMKESALRRKHVGMIYKEIYNDFPKEKFVGISRLGTPALILRDLDVIKNILIKDFDVFTERGMDFSKDRLGDNLFHCDENVWRALKGKLTPMFTASKLTHITPVVEECADRFVNYMEGLCDKPTELEMYYHFKKYTIATIVAFSFGLDLDVLYDTEGVFDKIDKDLFTTTHTSELDMLFPGILKALNISLFPASVNKFCHDIVRTALKERKNAPNGRNDVIDILLKLKETPPKIGDKDFNLEITDKLLVAQAFIFYIAGYGSNASTLSYMMFRLAQNPDVQDKLIEEIDEVLETHSGTITYETLKDMIYLDKVFHETLRMNPLTNSIQRVPVSDYKIPGTDVTIRKGTSVIISPYAIQRDEKHYPNPMKFDPERFAPENSRDRHSCAYLPFGNGPRTCLGMRFAKIQAAMCVVKLLSKYRVEPSHKSQEFEHYDPFRMFVFPKGGIYVNLIPRNM